MAFQSSIVPWLLKGGSYFGGVLPYWYPRIPPEATHSGVQSTSILIEEVRGSNAEADPPC